MNPLFLPVRVIERAFDDLGAIAAVARRLPELEEAAFARVDALVALIEGMSAGLDDLRRELAPLGELAEKLPGIG